MSFDIQPAGAIVVTGTLDPDATGTYYPVGNTGDHPYWERVDPAGGFFIFNQGNYYRLCEAMPYTTEPHWNGDTYIRPTWTPVLGATGIGTGAWSELAALARISVPPDNYVVPPLDLALYIYAGKPVTAGTQFYNGPWTSWLHLTEPETVTPAYLWRRFTWPPHPTGEPWTWPAAGTGKAFIRTVAQDMATGSISTATTNIPAMGSLSPW